MLSLTRLSRCSSIRFASSNIDSNTAESFLEKDHEFFSLWERARAKSLKRETDESIVLFDELLTKVEDREQKAHVIAMKGKAMLIADRVNEAVPFLEQSLQLNDTDMVRYELLRSYVKLKDFGLALQLGDLFDAGESTYHKAMLEIGNVLLRLNKMDEARKRFDSSSRSPNPSIQVEALIGRCKCEMFSLKTLEQLKLLESLFDRIREILEKKKLRNSYVDAEFMHIFADFHVAKQMFDDAKNLYTESIKLLNALEKQNSALLVAKKLSFALAAEAKAQKDPEVKRAMQEAAKQFEQKLNEELKKAMPDAYKGLVQEKD